MKPLYREGGPAGLSGSPTVALEIEGPVSRSAARQGQLPAPHHKDLYLEMLPIPANSF